MNNFLSTSTVTGSKEVLTNNMVRFPAQHNKCWSMSLNVDPILFVIMQLYVLTSALKQSHNNHRQHFHQAFTRQ